MSAPSTDLAIRDLAQRTGIAAGTLRMWEQRHGFPVPERASSGHRRYREEDVETLKRVVSLRERGLSVGAAIARARETGGAPHRDSVYAAVADGEHGARPQILRKQTLIALSEAIEHEALARAVRPVLIAAFQREPFYRAAQPRYARIAAQADAAFVFADFARPDAGGPGPVEIPIGPTDPLSGEWAVIVDAPGFAACLIAWELPDDARAGAEAQGRRFESLWTTDPLTTRRAAIAAARLAGRHDPAYGDQLEQVLADRPLASEQPSPVLTALTNRMIAYLERAVS
jgi:DICT domain-containing protein